MQHRAHRAIGDEDGIFQALIEILDFHDRAVLFMRFGASLRQRLESISEATVLIKSYLVRISKRASPISTKTAGFSWLRMCVTRSTGAVRGTCGSGLLITSRPTKLRRGFPLRAPVRDW